MFWTQTSKLWSNLSHACLLNKVFAIDIGTYAPFLYNSWPMTGTLLWRNCIQLEQPWSLSHEVLPKQDMYHFSLEWKGIDCRVVCTLVQNLFIWNFDSKIHGPVIPHLLSLESAWNVKINFSSLKIIFSSVQCYLTSPVQTSAHKVSSLRYSSHFRTNRVQSNNSFAFQLEKWINQQIPRGQTSFQ